SNRLGQKPAIHTNICSGNKTAGLVTSQKKSDPNQLFWFTKTAHGRMQPNGFSPLRWRAVIVKQQPAILLPGKEPRGNGVNADGFGCPFTCQEKGKAQQGRFGG